MPANGGIAPLPPVVRGQEKQFRSFGRPDGGRELPLDAPTGTANGGLNWAATVHDGVQLAQANYADGYSNQTLPQLVLAPGNRLDH